MKSLEELYENHLHSQYSGVRHETKEIADVKRVIKHVTTMKDILINLPNSSAKQKLLYELKFIESYMADMINMHSANTQL